jgi:tetratricopeptide (TPR) repeat protein
MGRYTIERELDAGTAGLSFLARDLQVGRLVAIHVLRPELAAAVRARGSERTVAPGVALDHPHITPTYESGDVAGLMYYVVAYCGGESLRARLRREGQLPLDDTMRIVRDVASALGHAHERGIVHGGLRPENIVLADGRALVAELWFTEALGRDGPATGAAALSDARYLSPEQVGGAGQVDRRTDIYSLGCVLYEMLGGEPPYTGTSPQAIIAKRLAAPIPHLRALRDTVPESVEQAVSRALAKAPDERFATVEHFVAALQPAAAIRLPDRRMGGLGAFAGAGVLLAAVIMGALLVRRSPADPPAASAASPDARRIAVAAFVNQTGDSSLDPLGDIIADYLSRGLAETRLVEVIDARAEQTSGTAVSLRDPAAARALATALGAGRIMWGSYGLRGDSLTFQARLTEAAASGHTDTVVRAMVHAREPTLAAEALRQRIMVSFAAKLDPRFAEYQTRAASRPANYEAYREYLAGEEALDSYIRYCPEGQDCTGEAVAHYRRAYSLDTNFTLAIVALAWVSGMHRWECTRVDSIANELGPRRTRLPAFDRAQLDWVVANCHGRRADELEAARQAMVAAPRSGRIALGFAFRARKNGFLREAIAVTERLDPARYERQRMYWGNLIIPFHLLGDHQRELETIRNARRHFPGNLEFLSFEARALVGLGQLTEVNARVDEMLRTPREAPQVGRLSQWLSLTGRDLRAHGHRREADAVFERAIRWIPTVIESRSADEQRELRFDRAELLYDAGRFTEARQALKRVASQWPADDEEVQVALGAVAGRLGDLNEVARIDRWLATRDRPYLNGKHTFYRARLAAIVGDRERAVELYRIALDQGYDFQGGFGIHSDPDFESLRGYPPFEALTAPKTERQGAP